MRRLVLVSGPPGAGKTTLAVPLAAELGLTVDTTRPVDIGARAAAVDQLLAA